MSENQPTISPPPTPRALGLKFHASQDDIVSDFYDVVQALRIEYRYQRDAQMALDRIEDIATWWQTNTPGVQMQSDPTVPWKHPDLEGWAIVGMNHYIHDDEMFLFVAMTRENYFIKWEGPDDDAIWANLRSLARSLDARREWTRRLSANILDRQTVGQATP